MDIFVIDKAKQPNTSLHVCSWTVEPKGSKNETPDSGVVDAASCWNFDELLAESTDPNKLVRACLFNNCFQMIRLTRSEDPYAEYQRFKAKIPRENCARILRKYGKTNEEDRQRNQNRFEIGAKGGHENNRVYFTREISREQLKQKRKRCSNVTCTNQQSGYPVAAQKNHLTRRHSVKLHSCKHRAR